MMDNELITKKELLEKYSISYGALYRWKRMGLIPEDWFIKKATVTGQETFMPRVMICERVEHIMQMKDETSLEALARSFNARNTKKRRLVVRTKYGNKEFDIGDIISLTLINDEVESDITESFMRITAERKSENE